MDKKILTPEEGIMAETKKLQEDMHKHIEWMMANNKKLSYDDCLTVFVLMKISEIKLLFNSITK
jgi:hypothetical protein